MKKTSVSYIAGKKITLELDSTFASLFQNLLLYFITTASDPNEVLDGYKKFKSVAENDPNVELTEYQSYLYCLTALCQNIKNSALEQGSAKEIEIPEHIVKESKSVAELLLNKNESNIDEINDRYKKLYEELGKLS
tara:strand:- start:816 stop:1223 length:408 start_codon:yes stop_codon:yes gene_type:complete